MSFVDSTWNTHPAHNLAADNDTFFGQSVQLCAHTTNLRRWTDSWFLITTPHTFKTCDWWSTELFVLYQHTVMLIPMILKTKNGNNNNTSVWNISVVVHQIRIVMLSHNSMRAEICESKNTGKCDMSRKIEQHWLMARYSHSYTVTASLKFI